MRCVIRVRLLIRQRLVATPPGFITGRAACPCRRRDRRRCHRRLRRPPRVGVLPAAEGGQTRVSRTQCLDVIGARKVERLCGELDEPATGNAPDRCEHGVVAGEAERSSCRVAPVIEPTQTTGHVAREMFAEVEAWQAERHVFAFRSNDLLDDDCVRGWRREHRPACAERGREALEAFCGLSGFERWEHAVDVKLVDATGREQTGLDHAGQRRVELVIRRGEEGQGAARIAREMGGALAITGMRVPSSVTSKTRWSDHAASSRTRAGGRRRREAARSALEDRDVETGQVLLDGGDHGAARTPTLKRLRHVRAMINSSKMLNAMSRQMRSAILGSLYTFA